MSKVLFLFTSYTIAFSSISSKDSYLASMLKIDITDVVLGVNVLALQHCLLTL